MTEPHVFIRQNHLSSHSIQRLKDHFYLRFANYRKERAAYATQRQKLRQQLSGFIEREPGARIAYIRLQQGMKRGKIQFEKIPKLEFVDPLLLENIRSHLIRGQELQQHEELLREQFEKAYKRQAEELYELFREQSNVQNALLFTNFEMYCSMNNSYSPKKTGKVWKIMMRSFAKTAPLSTFTSIGRTGDRTSTSRIRLAQWILLAWFDYFLLLPEVIRASRFRIKYEADPFGEAVWTVGAGEPLEVRPGLYQRQKRRFMLQEPRLRNLPSGSIVTWEELASRLGVGTDWVESRTAKLLAAGYLRNVLERKAETLTLNTLIDEASSFRNVSGRVDGFVRHLEALHLIASRLENTSDLHIRESLILSAQKHASACCDAVLWKGKRPLDLFHEDSYIPAGPHEIRASARRTIDKWADILPLFDHRLKFRLFMKELLQDRLPASYESLRQSLSEYAGMYEKEVALRRTSRNTVFAASPQVTRLEDLKDVYRERIKPAENGEDVHIGEDELMDLKAQLEEVGIKPQRTLQLLIQPAMNGKYVVNDCKNGYLAYSIYHDPGRHEQVLHKIRSALGCKEALLLTYSPSCGFNPNTNDFTETYSLTEEIYDPEEGGQPETSRLIALNSCTLEWNADVNRFELRAGDVRGIALYTGSLAPAYLPEDYRNIALLSQSGFLNGIGFEYNEISIGESRKLGRISFGDLILQRRRNILHSSLFSSLTFDLEGYGSFHELLESHDIPLRSFVRLFPVREGKLQIEYGATAIHKPIFFDAEEPLYVIEMLKHIQRSRQQYGDIAVVFEEALPDPYQTDYTAEYVYEM